MLANDAIENPAVALFRSPTLNRHEHVHHGEIGQEKCRKHRQVAIQALSCGFHATAERHASRAVEHARRAGMRDGSRQRRFALPLAYRYLNAPRFTRDQGRLTMNIGLPLTTRFIPQDYRLRIPGPAAIPERVRSATALPILSHRGPEFRVLLDEVTRGLRGILGTAHDVFLFGGSGTGGMEAALVNVLSTGDAVLVIENGQFGERFSSIAEGLPVQLDRLQIPWGQAPDAAEVAERLRARP